MSRSRILTSVATAALGMALLGACSAEALTERAVGFGLEQAIEGDQDIDLNFDGDNGGFTIQTDEGVISLNVDGDNAGLVFDTEDGSGAINITEDGLVYDTDEGSGVVNFDEDGIVFDTDEGEGEINFDEDGVTITTEDGTTGFIGGTEVPDAWPAAIGVPATVEPDGVFFSSFDAGVGVVTTGVFTHSADEDFGAHIRAVLLDAGWTVGFQSNDDGVSIAQFGNGNDSAMVVSEGNTTSMTLTVHTG